MAAQSGPAQRFHSVASGRRLQIFTHPRYILPGEIVSWPMNKNDWDLGVDTLWSTRTDTWANNAKDDGRPARRNSQLGTRTKLPSNEPPHTEVNEDAWDLGRAYELEEQPRCLSYRLAYLVASFYDMPSAQAISPWTRSAGTGRHLPVACMPDAACQETDVTIDRRPHAPARCTPHRLQAADVLRLAGFVYLVPQSDVIYQPAPKGLEAVNRTLRRYRCPPRPKWQRDAARTLRSVQNWPQIWPPGSLREDRCALGVEI